MNLSNNIKKVLHLNELQLMSCKKETKNVRTIKKKVYEANMELPKREV